MKVTYLLEVILKLLSYKKLILRIFENKYKRDTWFWLEKFKNTEIRNYFQKISLKE